MSLNVAKGPISQTGAQLHSTHYALRATLLIDIATTFIAVQEALRARNAACRPRGELSNTSSRLRITHAKAANSLELTTCLAGGRERQRCLLEYRLRLRGLRYLVADSKT